MDHTEDMMDQGVSGALPQAAALPPSGLSPCGSQAKPAAANAWFVEVEHEDNIDHEGDPEVYVCNQQTVCTATVVATIGTHTGLSLDEKVKCARLIAAAPELLGALVRAADEFELILQRLRDDQPERAQGAALCGARDARAAIAKASEA